MSQRKTDEQKLQELQKRMNQLKEQEKAIKAKASKKERAERTRRLIQNGALAEQYLQAQNISPAEFEKLLARLVELEQVKNIISPPANNQSGGVMSE